MKIKIKLIFNILLFSFFINILGYIGGINYIKYKYVDSIKNYYIYVENNIDNINKLIYYYDNPEILANIIYSLDTYFYMNEILIKEEKYKNLNDILIEQKTIFDRANYETYKKIYFASKELDENVLFFKKLIRNINKSGFNK